MSLERLLIAAANGDATTIASILDAGQDPNDVDPNVGNSALYNAVYRDHIEAVRVLLESGADPNLRLTYRSPVDNREERHVVALMYAMSADVATLLLVSGAQVGVADADGVTSLMRAARRGNRTVVEVLLKAGADCTQVTKQGKSVVDVLEDTMSKYRSWRVGANKDPIDEKLAELERIRQLVSANSGMD